MSETTNEGTRGVCPDCASEKVLEAPDHPGSRQGRARCTACGWRGPLASVVQLSANEEPRAGFVEFDEATDPAEVAEYDRRMREAGHEVLCIEPEQVRYLMNLANTAAATIFAGCREAGIDPHLVPFVLGVAERCLQHSIDADGTESAEQWDTIRRLAHEYADARLTAVRVGSQDPNAKPN